MNLHEGPTYWDKTLARDYQFEKLEKDEAIKNQEANQTIYKVQKAVGLRA